MLEASWLRYQVMYMEALVVVTKVPIKFLLSYKKVKIANATETAPKRCTLVTDTCDPKLPAPNAGLVLVEDAEAEDSLAAVPEAEALPEVPDRTPDVTLAGSEVDSETEVGEDDVALDTGSVRVTPVGGKLAVVNRSVVRCGGRVFVLDAARVWSLDEVSLPMIVKVGLMSPVVPNTAITVLAWARCTFYAR